MNNLHTRRNQNRIRLHLEALEDRAVPAVVTSFWDTGDAIAVDSQGDIYVSGRFSGSVDFDPGAGTHWLANNSSDSAPFLAKYSSSKQLVWVKGPTELANSGIYEMLSKSIGSNDLIYAKFANTTGYGMRVYAPDGTVLWSNTLSTTNDRVELKRFTVDPEGAVYFVGNFYGTVDFDGNALTTNDQLVSSYYFNDKGERVDEADSFILKWDNTGNYEWVTQLGGAGEELGMGIDIVNGELFAVGNYNQSFAPLGMSDAGTIGFKDGFILRLDPLTGSVVSGHRHIDNGWHYLKHVDGMHYLLGNDPSRDFVAQVNESSGNVNWRADKTGYGDMLTVADGSVYITSHFNNTFDFDPSPTSQFNMTAQGSSDIYLQKLNAANGGLVWAKQMGGYVHYSNVDELGRGIVVHGNALYSVGFFMSRDTDLDPGAGTAYFNADGWNDAYVSKLDINGNYQWAIQIGNQTRSADNSLAGYQEIGNGWKNYQYGGYQGSARFNMKGNGSKNAIWTITGLVPGQQYQVSATWNAQSKNATNAQYKVNGISVPTVNQRLAPDDFQDQANGYNWNNRRWAKLGTTTFAADATGKIVIELSDLANGNVVADGVRVVAVGASALHADTLGSNQVSALKQSDLNAIISAAQKRLKVSRADLAVLRNLNFQITDLPGTMLGQSVGNTIYLDANAAGHGWFIDRTPLSDTEFRLRGNQGEQGKMDLLSAVMHEMSHALGRGHSDHGLMAETLAAGARSVGTHVADAAIIAGLQRKTPYCHLLN